MTARCDECGRRRDDVEYCKPEDRNLCLGCFSGTNGHKPGAVGRELVTTRASTIRPRPVRWAWQGWAPLGAVSLLAGRQGLGKSTLIAGRIADLSRGRLDGDLRGRPVDTLLVSYEDHDETTIVPRLLAADADLDRVHIVGATCDGTADLVSLPDDFERLAELARSLEARFLAIDPLVASLPGKVDAHRDQDVRRVLASLARLAEDLDLAVLASIHLRKGSANEALDRISGSIAFTAAARSVLAFGVDPVDEDESRRILAHAKSNVGRLSRSRIYRIEETVVGGEISTARLRFEAESDARASELLSPSPPSDPSETESAAEWMADELADGEWHESRVVTASGKAMGYSEKVLRTARERLGVEHRREGFPAISEWRLPVMPSSEKTEGATVEGATEQTALASGIQANGRLSHALERSKGTTEPETLVLDYRHGPDRLPSAAEVEAKAEALGLSLYDDEEGANEPPPSCTRRCSAHPRPCRPAPTRRGA